MCYNIHSLRLFKLLIDFFLKKSKGKWPDNATSLVEHKPKLVDIGTCRKVWFFGVSKRINARPCTKGLVFGYPFLLRLLVHKEMLLEKSITRKVEKKTWWNVKFGLEKIRKPFWRHSKIRTTGVWHILAHFELQSSK